MSINSDLETANKAGFELGREVGIKDGYEKGVMDMFEEKQCSHYCSGKHGCDENLKTCPIAQKLLKAVVK